MTQEDFGALAGITRKTQRLYEAGERAPDVAYLAAIAAAEADVLYVVTGQRSNVASSRHLTEMSESVTQGRPNAATSQHLVSREIDAERLTRIVEMLEAFASNAGKRWPSGQLVAVAAEVYNVLVDEPALDEPKVERILKLVVNR